MAASFDLLCFSHLRWDFVYQRPQHLLNRCAEQRRVFFVEEPVFDAAEPRLQVSRRQRQLYVVVPHLPRSLLEHQATAVHRQLIGALLAQRRIQHYVLWYYTPMAIAFTQHLEPLATVYDCMDELALFKGAPAEMHEREAELLRRADLVFTGGESLYESKRDQRSQVYAFPSGVDIAHFAQARRPLDVPSDQAPIPRPRLGFAGVIDERMDQELLAGVAGSRPDWHFVMVGPVVKIDPAGLPRRANIHYLGPKPYDELPAYLAGWDVALLPFARNEATRFISPTKTPEYLAAGKPVVSTSIRDVVRAYGERGLVRIADTVEEWVAALTAALREGAGPPRAGIDTYLADMSWDRIWARMAELLDTALATRRTPAGVSPQTGAHLTDGDHHGAYPRRIHRRWHHRQPPPWQPAALRRRRSRGGSGPRWGAGNCARRAV